MKATVAMKAALPIRILSGIGSTLLALFGLGTLGSLFPNILLLGEIGPLLTASYGPWIAVLSLLGAVWAYRRWRGNRKRRTLLVTSLATLAALGMSFIQYSQIKVARSHGAKINVAAAFLARSQADDSLKPDTIFYAKHDGQDLPIDIYRPAPRGDGKTSPVFIYIHGGGWSAETLKQRQADLKWFAQAGYVVLSFEYPLATEKRPTWNVTHPLLGCALVWANANAARYGGDPARIALWGESAGGNLLLNVAYAANAGTLKPSCPGTLPHIAAAAALYPVVNSELMYHNPDPLIGRFGRMMTTRYTGGTPQQFPDRYAEINSSTHISAQAPPTLLIIPEADHLVVPEAAYAFDAKARAAGVRTQLITMPYAEHSFDLKSDSIGNQMVRQTMLKFLTEHGLKP